MIICRQLPSNSHLRHSPIQLPPSTSKSNSARSLPPQANCPPSLDAVETPHLPLMNGLLPLSSRPPTCCAIISRARAWQARCTAAVVASAQRRMLCAEGLSFWRGPSEVNMVIYLLVGFAVLSQGGDLCVLAEMYMCVFGCKFPCVCCVACLGACVLYGTCMMYDV